MSGRTASERAPSGEDEEAGDPGFQPIGQAAWRALKQANARRKAGRAGTPETDNGH